MTTETPARPEDQAAMPERKDRYQVSVEEYRRFRMNGYLIVRGLVSPDEVDDLAAAQVARTVAKQIEQELTYPGQVRVTVIRESRVSEIAH